MLKLYYFDIPGRGESLRLFCIYANLQFEDCRLTQQEFQKLKDDGKLPFAQVPALEVDNGVMIVQSAAIIRYLSKLTTYHPTCPIQCALIDSIIDQENDMFTGLIVSRYQARFGFNLLSTQQDLVMTIRKELNDVTIPRHLAQLDSLMASSQTGWIANTPEPSIADFMLVPRLQWLISGQHDGISLDILKPFTHLTALMDRFLNLPAIKNYYATKK